MRDGKQRHQGDDNPPETVRLEAASLTVFWPDGRETDYPLTADKIRVGRDKHSNDLVIPEAYASISRNHLELHRRENKWWVTDLQTTNGVFVRGNRIQAPTELKVGDEIRIGAPEFGHAVRMVFNPGSIVAEEEGPTRGAATAQTRVASEVMGGPYLDLHLTGGVSKRRPIETLPCLVGRSPEAQVQLDDKLRYVSAKHLEIRREGDGFTVCDLDSTNGTWLNGRKLTPHEPVELQENARLRIGDNRLGVSVGLTFHSGRAGGELAEGYTPTAVRSLADLPELTVLLGRDENADIQLDSPTVSRRHASLERRGQEYWIRDLDSLNGTLVNGKSITETLLSDGDVVEIQDHVLVFREGELRQYDSWGVRIEGRDLTQRVKTQDGQRTILDQVGITVQPREFVALVGPSGAGKSTLMNALMGVWPADGEVRVNGRDLYAEYERFRSQIGYVPQDDILHTSLTVERALDYAARLRLPADFTAREREERIKRVLETVAMNETDLRQTRIEDLSGGQRKRVSIAAELLADPKLFFLDEATSGLDPRLEKKMMHTLRRMADEGRTVILITHATANIVQVDHVAFLGDGKLTYFGPPHEALDFFEVDEFSDIYERIQGAGEAWRQRFVESETGYYDRYVSRGQLEIIPAPSLQDGVEGQAQGLGGLTRQLAVLTQRTFSVLTSDRLQLLLLLLMFPLAALFLIVVSSPEILTGDPAVISDPAEAARDLAENYTPYDSLSTFIFTLALDGVLIGMFLPSNELIGERVIYLRERMVNLAIAPYVLSKVIAFTTFIAIQAALSVVVLRVGLRFPASGAFMPFDLELFGSLFFTMLAGVGIGLVISAVSRSPDMATYILVVLTFFQFFFSGTAFDLRNHPAETLTHLTATRWSMLGIGISVDVPRQARSTILCQKQPDNPATERREEAEICRHYPEAEEDLILHYHKPDLPKAWTVLMAMALAGIGVTGVVVRRMDPL